MVTSNSASATTPTNGTGSIESTATSADDMNSGSSTPGKGTQSNAAASSGSKRKRRTIRKPYYYSSSAVEHIENRCLIQAIQNSKVDRQIRRSLTSNDSNNADANRNSDGTNQTDDDIPYGPVFYPTVQQFVGMNPIEYITEHVKPIAEQYGICKIVPPKGWQDHIKTYFHIPIVVNHDTGGSGSGSDVGDIQKTNSATDRDADSNGNTTNTITANTATTPTTIKSHDVTTDSAATATTVEATSSSERYNKAFETKYQLLHRIQEGIDFQDGSMYTSSEYVKMAYQQTLQYKNMKYPLHDLLSKYQNTNTDTSHPNIYISESGRQTCGTNQTINGSMVNPQNTETNDDNGASKSDTTNSTSNASKHLYSIANLEQDYWDIVEMVQQSDNSSGNHKFVVEYGNDVDTHIYGSGFPLSYDPTKSIYTATAGTTNTKSCSGTANNKENHQVKKKVNTTTTNGDIGMTSSSTTGHATTTSSATTSSDHMATNGIEGDVEEAKLQELFQTEAYYRDTYWNLNNIPCAPQSVLRHVKVAINGINVPWMYYGSLFTTFCWHNEDNYLYSINYHHMGSPKQWYGVPGIPKDAPEGLEKVFKSYLSMKMRDVPDLLHHITTMFSPRLVQNRSVPVYKMVQYEGEFIITFPRAYHCGFSYGPNIGEAVNFATCDWIPYGADANEKYRLNQRPAVFSHDRLVFTMANHCEREQISYHTCKLLVNELQRIIDEELSLRSKLLSSGVRDVSSLIHLRPNRFDQLDEESANYDDQRTCHYCKYICYFTAVACQCSHSKVSCLRHSHFMCTCANTSKYLMIWSTKNELVAMLDRVKKHCTYLSEQEKSNGGTDGFNTDVTTHTSTGSSNGKNKNKSTTVVLTDIAPGAQDDYKRHKNDPILTDPRTWFLKQI